MGDDGKTGQLHFGHPVAIVIVIFRISLKLNLLKIDHFPLLHFYCQSNL